MSSSAQGLTPAEEWAARENAPVLLLIPYECLRIATGHPMRVRLSDGTEALARLFTEDEFYGAHVEACRSTGIEPASWAEVAPKARPIQEVGW